jgi:hypothetical protein
LAAYLFCTWRILFDLEAKYFVPRPVIISKRVKTSVRCRIINPT